MSTAILSRGRTIASLLHELGDVSADRVRLEPTPGTATVADLDRPENNRCELIDGTLVEKAVGWEESRLACWLSMVINTHVLASNLGIVTGGDGFTELESGNFRSPDVAFFSWGRMPGRRRPKEPYPRLTPDIAVEVLSLSNTRTEMDRKRTEYFDSGTAEVWEIDPRARTVRVYTAADRGHDLGPADALDGGAILPGLRVPVADLFAELDRHG